MCLKPKVKIPETENPAPSAAPVDVISPNTQTTVANDIKPKKRSRGKSALKISSGGSSGTGLNL